MKKLLTVVSLCCLFLASCNMLSTQNLQAQRQPFTSVSVSSPTFTPKIGQRFAWYTPAVTWATANPIATNTAIEQSIIQTIEQELVARGYTMTVAPEEADFIIGMVITTDDYKGSKAFTQYFNLSAASTHKKTARALVGIFEQKYWGMTPPPSDALIWKADLETRILDDATPQNIKLDRAKALTARLMSGLPKGR